MYSMSVAQNECRMIENPGLAHVGYVWFEKIFWVVDVNVSIIKDACGLHTSFCKDYKP